MQDNVPDALTLGNLSGAQRTVPNSVWEKAITKESILNASLHSYARNCPPVKHPGLQSMATRPALPRSYKTELCHFYYDGRCRNGPDCRWAHGVNDLKLRSESGEQPSYDVSCAVSIYNFLKLIEGEFNGLATSLQPPSYVYHQRSARIIEIFTRILTNTRCVICTGLANAVQLYNGFSVNICQSCIGNFANQNTQHYMRLQLDEDWFLPLLGLVFDSVFSNNICDTLSVYYLLALNELCRTLAECDVQRAVSKQLVLAAARRNFFAFVAIKIVVVQEESQGAQL